MGVTQSTASEPQAARRKDGSKHFYLVFGEPRITYTGTSRGPLLFHVFVPPNERLDAVDQAETVRYLAQVMDRPTVRRGASQMEVEFRIVTEVATQVRIYFDCKPKLQAGTGLLPNGARTLHEAIVSRGEHVVSCRIEESAWKEAINATTSEEPNGSALPSCCPLILDMTYTCPTEPSDEEGATAEEEGERAAPPVPSDPIQHSIFALCSWEAVDDARATAQAKDASYLITLLQRDKNVFRIDDVFDPGRNDRNDSGVEGEPQDGDAVAAEGGGSESDEEDDLCVICLSTPKDTVALPCRHLCMCAACAQMLRDQSNKCPMCRSTIERLMTRRTL